MPTPQNSTILDDRDKIAQIDKSNVLGSIESLAEQIEHGWSFDIDLSTIDNKNIQNIVVAGMGGSQLGADIIKHLFYDKLKIPFEIVNFYKLPKYTDQNTLVIISSYSGNTEEIVSCFKQAIDLKAKIIAISSNGKVQEIAKQNNLPFFKINTKYNPSNQPRMAIGYSVIAFFKILSQLKLIDITEQDIKDIKASITFTNELCKVDEKSDSNLAKNLAFMTYDRYPILIASEFLIGAVHTARNQFCENAKVFADYKVLPELNHYLLEGLKFPYNNKTDLFFIFINSDLYMPKIQKRLFLTQELVQNLGFQNIRIDLKMDTKLKQIFETIVLLSYTNFYLAMLEGIDPAPIPSVNWFKSKLK